MSNQDKQTQMHALITKQVMTSIENLQVKGRLTFPENYNVANAVQAAYLKIKETEDKNHRSALEVCTQESIIQSVMNMAVQGLNPVKNQCYFIVYGNKLGMQRSYFGSIAVAKQLNPDIEDIYAEVVYQGDEFKIARKRGRTIVTEHTTALENINKNKIKAAYATVLYEDGREESIVMTIEQIHQSWRQSKMSVFDEKGNIKASSVHGKFTEEMAKKSVINRLCKHLINTTDDSVLAQSIKSTDETLAIDNAKEIIDISANKEEFIDVEPQAIESTQEDNQEAVYEDETDEEIDMETGEYIATELF